LTVGGQRIAPGERKRIEIPVARVPATRLLMPMPVEVLVGREPGPRVWVSGVIHGDELNGVEIVRQVLARLDPAKLRGAVLAVPIVNMFAFVAQSRYLPDRRDLNRSFPGSARGSLASRLADVFMRQVVDACTHGIDLHTGSDHRRNLPQLRADLRDAETRRCALAFGAPVAIDARTRDGSLRDAATRRGKHVLLYEAGEPQRFNRDAVRTGVRGVLRVLEHLGMIEAGTASAPAGPTAVATATRWVRARTGGLVRIEADLGARVERGERLGVVADAFGEEAAPLAAPVPGIVIGRANNPVARRGDALVHLATAFER
jgi:hypothetical protein